MADRFMYMGKDLTGAPGLLSGLADVNISSTPSDKQVLSYNETSEKWEPHSIAADDIAYDNDNSVKDEIDKCLKYDETVWRSKTWNDYSPAEGNLIWTDGENIYYSLTTTQYVLDKSTNTWNTKTWTGLTSFYGNSIWTDGENIYYSNAADQYVLDKSTDTWNTKTWTGLTNFYGNSIWTDGENIYSSSGSKQYILNKSTSTWETKTWTELTNFSGSDIWTDGENIYYSAPNKHYILDKSTSTWEPKIWSGIQSSFRGTYIWTDGKNIYYSSSSSQCILDKVTGIWYSKTWNVSSSLMGSYVWTDGENTYYSKGSDQYVLVKTSKDIQDLQDQVDTNANDISTLNSAIDAINNTHIRGLKWKTFSYTYNAATVAGNVYSVSSAKQTVFGLTASDTIVGISITAAGGNNNSVFTIPLYSAYNDTFVFKPDASNTSLTGFGGVVFYQ